MLNDSLYLSRGPPLTTPCCAKSSVATRSVFHCVSPPIAALSPFFTAFHRGSAAHDGRRTAAKAGATAGSATRSWTRPGVPTMMRPLKGEARPPTALSRASCAARSSPPTCTLARNSNSGYTRSYESTQAGMLIWGLGEHQADRLDHAKPLQRLAPLVHLQCELSGWTEHQPSRRRDCHSAAPPPPSTFSRCFNMDGERASAK